MILYSAPLRQPTTNPSNGPQSRNSQPPRRSRRRRIRSGPTRRSSHDWDGYLGQSVHASHVYACQNVLDRTHVVLTSSGAWKNGPAACRNYCKNSPNNCTAGQAFEFAAAENVNEQNLGITAEQIDSNQLRVWVDRRATNKRKRDEDWHPNGHPEKRVNVPTLSSPRDRIRLHTLAIGFSNSLDWVDALKPLGVVYSAGKRYNHPACLAVGRWRDELSLLTFANHAFRCDYNTATNVTKAEFTTDSSGTIVFGVNANGTTEILLPPP